MFHRIVRGVFLAEFARMYLLCVCHQCMAENRWCKSWSWSWSESFYIKGFVLFVLFHRVPVPRPIRRSVGLSKRNDRGGEIDRSIPTRAHELHGALSRLPAQEGHNVAAASPTAKEGATGGRRCHRALACACRRNLQVVASRASHSHPSYTPFPRPPTPACACSMLPFVPRPTRAWHFLPRNSPPPGLQGLLPHSPPRRRRPLGSGLPRPPPPTTASAALRRRPRAAAARDRRRAGRASDRRRPPTRRSNSSSSSSSSNTSPSKVASSARRCPPKDSSKMGGARATRWVVV